MNISNIPDYPTFLTKQQEMKDSQPAQIDSVQPLMGEQAELDVGEVLEAVQKANAALTSNQSNLKFMLDTESGRSIVQIIDRETEEVLKQIPSVEMLKIAKALEKMQGVLLSLEA